MAVVAGAMGMAAVIMVDKAALAAGITSFAGSVSIVQEFACAASVGAKSEGSKVLAKYAQSLEDTLRMVQSLTEILAKDATTYQENLIQFIKQDR